MLTVNLRDSKCTNEELKQSKISTSNCSFTGNETQTGDESKSSSKQSNKNLRCPESPSKQSKLSKKISSSLIGFNFESALDNIKVCLKIIYVKNNLKLIFD